MSILYHVKSEGDLDGRSQGQLPGNRLFHMSETDRIPKSRHDQVRDLACSFPPAII